jgi:hypothetical protein
LIAISATFLTDAHTSGTSAETPRFYAYSIEIILFESFKSICSIIAPILKLDYRFLYRFSSNVPFLDLDYPFNGENADSAFLTVKWIIKQEKSV